ncbi:MAG: hypothetical protein AAF985_15375, partial [Bacteroidota bacterium]
MNKSPLPKPTSKLFQVLQKFSSTQLTSFRKYLRSPYFHQTEGVKVLFQYLRKYHPKYVSRQLDDRVIAQQLFPKSKNGLKKVQNFKSDLMQHVEQFLVFEQMKQEPIQQKFLLAKAYQDLGLAKQAKKAIGKAQQVLEKSSAIGLSHLQYSLDIAHYDYFHPDTHKLFKNPEKLQHLHDQLDQYYVLAKFKYAYEVNERNKSQSEQFNLRLWEAVQQLVETDDQFQAPLPLLLYLKLDQLTAQAHYGEPDFQALQEQFFQQLNLLEKEDQQAIFTYLINYTVRAMDAGQLHFAAIQFALFQKGLSHHLIVRKNRISIASFLNIISIAATCQAFTWIQEFVATYQDFLHPILKPIVLEIGQAQIFFHQQKPEKALSILNAISPIASDLEIVSRPLAIKVLFELLLQDPTFESLLLSQIKSFPQLYKRKYAFSPEKKEAYQNFIA